MYAAAVQNLGEDPTATYDSRSFGARMKRAREEERLTQRELSELLEQRRVKLDSSAITRIERGMREPRLGEAIAIAETLGFTLSTADVYNIDDGEKQFASGEAGMKRQMVRARRRILDACVELHIAFDGLLSDEEELRVLQRRGAKTPLEWAKDVHDEMVQRFSVEDEAGRANYVEVTDHIHRQMLETIVAAVTWNLFKTEEEIHEMTVRQREVVRDDMIRRAKETLVEALGNEEFDRRFGKGFDDAKA